MPPAIVNQMTQYRAQYGFHDLVPSLFNVFKHNDKWFQDRNGNYFGLLPSGQVIQYDGASFYLTTGLPLLDPLVYDDPTLLFKATTEQDTGIAPLGSLEVPLHSPQVQLEIAESQCLLRLRHVPFIGQSDDFHYRRCE